jgi:hypothetical protein
MSKNIWTAWTVDYSHWKCVLLMAILTMIIDSRVKKKRKFKRKARQIEKIGNDKKKRQLCMNFQVVLFL